MDVAFFLREVGGLVAIGSFHLLTGLDANQAIGGGAVDAVGFEPHALFERAGNIFNSDRRGGSELDLLTAGAAIVVHGGISDSDGNVEIPVVRVGSGGEDAEGGAYDVSVEVGDLIRHEVGWRVGFFQRVEIALEFLAHGVENNRVAGSERHYRNGQKRGQFCEFHND